MSKIHTTPINREMARAIDHVAIEQFGISGLVLMENAGRGCVETLCSLGIDGPVVICCGKGNNAGDGFVIARHLDLRDREAKVLLFSDPADLTGDAASNLHILEQTDVPIVVLGDQFNADQLKDQLVNADWIIDALLGTGAQGDPRPPLDQVIRVLNDWPARRLAVDLPSGLDCDTGHTAPTTFQADHTCTFVAPKIGFAAAEARRFVGQWHVIDIGVPRQVIQAVVG